MRTAALTLTAIPRLALRLPRRLRLFTVLALVAAIALAALYYAWFRDSSLVKVQEVQVTGLTGPEAARVRETLKRAGLEMTTLNVSEEELRRAVEAEPSILRLSAAPDFPHKLRIDITENHPVAAIAVPGSGQVPLAGNGTLMPGEKVAAPVPVLKIAGVAKTGRDGTAAARLTDDRARPLLRIAATAPPALLRRATTIERRKGEGIVVLLKDGPRVMFGDGSAPAAKWRAAAGVLAAASAQGAAYVDVRLPERPVAGGLKAQTPAGGVAVTPGASATTPTAPAPDPAPVTPSTPTGGSPPATGTAEPAAPAQTPTPAAPVTPQTQAPNTQP
jgi:cell division septal protein FtsQ